MTQNLGSPLATRGKSGKRVGLEKEGELPDKAECDSYGHPVGNYLSLLVINNETEGNSRYKLALE